MTHMEHGLAPIDEFDFMRVREWALNDTRPANTAFTAGTNRNVAYLIEELRLDLNKSKPIEPDYKAERDLLARALVDNNLSFTKLCDAVDLAQRIL